MRIPFLFVIVIVMSISSAAQTLPPPQAVTDPKQIASQPNALVEKSLTIEKLYMTRSTGGTAWSPDGKTVAFVSNISGRNNLWLVPSAGGWPTQLTISDQRQGAPAWSPDGKWIAYNTWPGAQHLELFSLETLKTQPYNLAQSAAARFSPDGKWVAYRSGETGRTEIYVQPFPATGARWQISTAGGEEAAWSGDGKELFYSTGAMAAKIMAVDIAVKNDAMQAGIPHALFSVKLEAILSRCRWVVTRDGTKFLAAVPREERPAVVSLSVIHNWPALLEKR